MNGAETSLSQSGLLSHPLMRLLTRGLLLAAVICRSEHSVATVRCSASSRRGDVSLVFRRSSSKWWSLVLVTIDQTRPSDPNK
ncbi:hypothetical protein J6590_005113 [Homalodisca vitripennis]|nr:hypothetical protein J6590_005113 [Homalodisca vitripennis]